MLRFLASERGIKNLGITWRNIVTDYGATPGGSSTSTGDYTAFKAFHDWALLQSGWVGLELPPSSGNAYYGTNGSYTYHANAPFFGIPQLVVMGYGAAMTGLHGVAFVESSTERAAIYTVQAGSRTVQLKDVGDAGKFDVDRMVIIAGVDMQGYGYPPNPHFFEWRRVVGVSGDVVTLDEPLTHYYSENWPNYFTSGIGGFGAATIARTKQGWDCHHKIFGVRSHRPGEQTYYFVRKAELFDVRSDDNGFIIGAAQTHKIVNQTHTASNMEVDKLTESALIGEYGPSNRNINIQSSSVQYMEVRGGTRSISGTAKNMLIHGGSSPSITFGPTAYGVTESLTIRNHSFAALGTPPSMNLGIGTDLTYEGDGVFRYVGESPPQWLVPGAVGFLETAESPYFDFSPFRVLSIEADAPDVLIQTTLTGGSLPEVSGYTTGVVVRHYMPNLTVENCTGSPQALELSQTPANSPFGIFKQRTLDGLSNANSMGFLMGRLVHIKVNVLTPYTGAAGTLNLTIGGQNGSWVINSDWTATRHQTSRVNLKVAGERVITPSGVTGAQSGDTNLSNFAADLWMPYTTGFGAYIGNSGAPVDISGESAGVRPIVTVEVLTDQEIPAAA